MTSLAPCFGRYIHLYIHTYMIDNANARQHHVVFRVVLLRPYVFLDSSESSWTMVTASKIKTVGQRCSLRWATRKHSWLQLETWAKRTLLSILFCCRSFEVEEYNHVLIDVFRLHVYAMGREFAELVEFSIERIGIHGNWSRLRGS